MAPFSPFEVTTPHIAYTCLGGFIVLFGMFSLFLREKVYIGEANWAFLFGIIIGPYAAGIFDPRGWAGGDSAVGNIVTLEVTRVVLAIGVFAIGVELPKAYMARHWKSIFFLLGPIMTWGWFVCAGLIYALIPGLNFLSSLAIAACLTPTDPILAAAVIGGKYADKHVPAHIRHLLAAESGCNDGAAFPFLFIALYLIMDLPDVGAAIKDWFLILWLYQVVFGTAIGVGLGFGFRYLMKFCERRNLIDRHSYVAQYISLAMLATGVTTLLGSDDLLSAFACGAAFAWDGFFNKQTEESLFSSVIDLLFNIAAFVFVGAWMPFSSFRDAELTLSIWRLVVIGILILLLRRIPIVLALYKWIPDIKTFREALFVGHFGPMGIGAVFISTLASEVLHKAKLKGEHEPNAQTELLEKTIQPITAFMVFCSIIIHGLSIPSFSLGRRVHSVSRTWSRHAQPDWTNQTQMVGQPNDIVINRDFVDGMERGEGSSSQDEKLKEKDSETPSTDDVQRNVAGGSPEGAEPPDGTDIVSVWDEGRHRVIERRKGPGEEVEVEVIRNHGTPESSSEKFQGSRSDVREQIHAYLAKFKHIMGHEAHKAEELEQRLKEIVKGDEEDDEGWASDTSSPPTTGGSGDARRRSKSPRSKVPPKLGTTARASKRRNSMRRGILSPHRVGSPGPSSPVAEEPRGRNLSINITSPTSEPASPGSQPGTPGSSIRHARLDRVHALSPGSRDVSPSRSIRFADSQQDPTPSGAATPRLSVYQDSSSGSATPAERPEPTGETAEGRGKITFELPDPKKPTP